VKILTKRNALIGFLTVKAVKRRGFMPHRQPKRPPWKLAALISLGVISFGVLAVLGAVALRRQREPEHIEGYVVAAEDESPIQSSYAETPETFAASA
jgi:hypothetical protein